MAQNVTKYQNVLYGPAIRFISLTYSRHDIAVHMEYAFVDLSGAISEFIAAEVVMPGLRCDSG